jgi:metal-responsive CopG/Arc/MetJ family transcriptional regulator
MSVISLRLSEELLHDIDNNAQKMHLNRAEYIRQAIELMNQRLLLKARRQRLADASRRVRKESMKVNQAFSEFEFDDEDNPW